MADPAGPQPDGKPKNAPADNAPAKTAKQAKHQLSHEEANRPAHQAGQPAQLHPLPRLVPMPRAEPFNGPYKRANTNTRRPPQGSSPEINIPHRGQRVSHGPAGKTAQETGTAIQDKTFA